MANGPAQPELVHQIQSEAGPVPQLELKAETEQELISNLLEAGEWGEQDKKLVQDAIDLAQVMHAADTYKGQPYIYHSLRIANRIVRYMDIKDAQTVVAALLHDVVEDHAPELVGDDSVTDREQLQKLAFGIIANRFGYEASSMVAAVTNEPDQPGQVLSYEQKMDKYAAKVWDATSTFNTWAIKFSDWCENGLGLIHSELPSGDEKMIHFVRKYGGRVLDTQVYRYKSYKDQLTPKANNYVITQLTLAFQRLVLEVPHRNQDGN